MNTFRIYKTLLICLSIGLLSLFASCNKDDNDGNSTTIDETYKPVALTPISGLRIAWDYGSLTKLANTGSCPKMLRVSDEILVVVYESGYSIYAIISSNNGVSWGAPLTLFAKGTHQGKNGENTITYTDLMTQPTIIKLSNGDIVAACAVIFQYTLNNLVTEYPAAIRTRRFSLDGTLENAQQVYCNLGCESPNLLDLPNGELQLYFANSTTAQTVEMMSSTGLLTSFTEQQIEMIYSSNQGKTWSGEIKEFGADGVDLKWSGAKKIAYRASKFNNNPSAAIIGSNIVIAYGDNKTVTFKPYVVRTSVESNWPYPINGDSPEREYAIYELLPDKYFMGYPSLLALPSGESLIAYETDADRNENCETLEVVISEKDALNFTKASRPLNFVKDKYATLNSLSLFDDNTIIALTTSNYLSSSDAAPLSIKGHLINDLSITSSEIENHPLFIGGLSETNTQIGLGIDASNFYVEAVVTDKTPFIANTSSQNGDGIYLYIDAANLSLLDVDAGISKLWISSNGDIVRWDGKEGVWVKGSADGISATVTSSANGYTLSITIPKNKLTNFNSKAIRFGAGLSDYTSAETGTIELLSLCKDLRSSSWLGVTF